MSLLSFLQSRLIRQARLALAREQPYVIAITGAVGKSSTKRAIAALFHADEPRSGVYASPKSYNNELGLCLTIFGCSAPGRSLKQWVRLLWKAEAAARGWKPLGIRTYILEMGADHPGDIAQLVSIAKPNLAVITAVTPEDPFLAPVHVANYPSIEALVEEKAALVKAVGEDGIVVLNADDTRVFAMRHLTSAYALTFGEADGTDVRLIRTEVVMKTEAEGRIPTGFYIVYESFNRRREMVIPGVFGHSIAHALCAAVTVGAALDMGQDAMDGISDRFRPLPGRVRILPGIRHTTLFDDTYNASPAATLSAIRDLGSLPLLESQRRILCMGEMRELGSYAESLHRRIGQEAARQKIDLFIVCGTLARVMAEGALGGGMKEEQIKIFDDTGDAIPFLREQIRPGDIILAKASEGKHDSKGVRMERVIKALMLEPERASELLVRQEFAWQTRR